MRNDVTESLAADADRFKNLNQEWQALCARYLPVVQDDSIWRYNRAQSPQDPEQGWKLHLPATVLNACILLQKVASLLIGRGVQFKAPASLQELSRINSGLHHGYSQVGKCITVYPRTTEEALSLASELHRLTSGMAAPVVPFDLRFQPNSNVYYRYGAFRRMAIEHADGTSTPALRDPQGNLVPDLRASESAKPDWVQNPFSNQAFGQSVEQKMSPLKTTYRAFRALTQRGKGGVYQAIDLTAQPPRFCVLKEGRKYGELGWDGRDGCWHVRHEEQVLLQLQSLGLCVPRIYSSFELENNYYLIIEFIEGESLQGMLNRRQRRLSVAQALRYGSEMAAIMHRIHSAGWVWRDCKPSNFIITKQGGIRPIDFEGACPVGRPDPLPWGTPAFAPPVGQADHESRSSIYDDFYSLGVIIYLLLTGRLPEASALVPMQKLRRGIPGKVQQIVAELCIAPPRQRPDAGTVARELTAALNSLKSLEV